MIATDSLCLGYDEETIIEPLNVRIPRGSFTVLIGSNGCGKSTLLKGLSRLMKPKGGTVWLGDEDLSTLPRKKIARQLGFLPQNPQTPEGLSVEELVRQGRYAHQGFFPRWTREDEASLERALGICGLDPIRRRNVARLSGGQRQRVWIAMALAQESPLLMMDEPTSALDLKYQMEILDLLTDLNRKGRTIVLVLHDINMACRYASHLIALKGGKIIKEGSPEEIITPGLLREVFDLEARVIPDPLAGKPLVIPVPRFPAG